MNGRGRHTAEALPAVIRQLGKAGYRFVTVGELLDLASKRDPAVPRTDARK
jgi:hypothetical protein